jgi:hypothetical protein
MADAGDDHLSSHGHAFSRGPGRSSCGPPAALAAEQVARDHHAVHLGGTFADALDPQLAVPALELVRSGATMGDIVEKLKGVWGVYRETPVF